MPSMRSMFRASLYVKNLPTWERWLRIGAAVAIGACAAVVWSRLHHGPAAITLLLSAAFTAATAAVGFCPMCALAGRRIDQALSRR